MDRQLEWIGGLAKRRGIRCWADTGTLLGLVREGRPLDHDGDLDLSVWDEEIERLSAAAPEIAAAGYRSEVWTSGGKLFKWKFVPRAGHGLRTIDFKVYRRLGAMAWCPQPYEREPRRKLPWFLARALRRTALRCTRFRELRDRPWSWFYAANTWWIPAGFFDALDGRRHPPVSVPAASEEYLRLHYGGWRTPRALWDCTAEDGAILKAAPETLSPDP